MRRAKAGWRRRSRILNQLWSDGELLHIRFNFDVLWPITFAKCLNRNDRRVFRPLRAVG
jgi:hypothetical protein